MVTSPGSWWQSRTFAPPAMESHSRGRGFDSPRLHFHATGTPIARSTAFSISTIRPGARVSPNGRGMRRSRRSVVICSHFAMEGRRNPPSRARNLTWVGASRSTLDSGTLSRRWPGDCGRREKRQAPGGAWRPTRRESETSTADRAWGSALAHSLVPPASHHLITKGRPVLVRALLCCTQRAIVAFDRLIQLRPPPPPYPGRQSMLEDLTPGHPTSEAIGFAQQAPIHADRHLRLGRHGMTVYPTNYRMPTSLPQRQETRRR